MDEQQQRGVVLGLIICSWFWKSGMGGCIYLMATKTIKVSQTHLSMIHIDIVFDKLPSREGEREIGWEKDQTVNVR